MKINQKNVLMSVKDRVKGADTSVSEGSNVLHVCAPESSAKPSDSILSGRNSRNLHSDSMAALSMIQNGLSDISVINALVAELGCGRKHALNCLDRAYELLTESLENRGRSEQLARAVEQRENIIAKALGKEDLRVALSAIESRDKLLELSSGESSPATLVDLIELACKGLE